MVESKGGDNQVQKLIDLLGERVFPKRNLWVYGMCAAISTIIVNLIWVFYLVVIPFFNYVSLPFYSYAGSVFNIGSIVYYVFLWRQNRYRFGVPHEKWTIS